MTEDIQGRLTDKVATSFVSAQLRLGYE